MDPDGRLRRALAAFGGGGDLWDLVDAALAAAARDSPDELCRRRDGIVEQLYAGGRCRNCDAPLALAQLRAADEAATAAAATAASPSSPDEEVDADGLGEDEADASDGAGLESKILAIRDFLEDPDQSEEEMVSLLQNLADMDITYKALQETDIGRYVNSLRKHESAEVRQLVKLLVRRWKEIVHDWVQLPKSTGGGGSIISDGDSPDKFQPKYHQENQDSDFKYSPSSQRHNGFSQERSSNHNLMESTMEKRRTSPAPTYHNTNQNTSNNYSTGSASAPAMTMREQKELLDPGKLDSARKRLQENYREAQNARKQRTIQVMEIHDIPKPKNRNTFIRKSGGGGGLPGRHR